jgi:hypothetical protein
VTASILVGLLLLATGVGHADSLDEWMATVGEHLRLRSDDGFWSAQARGTLDLELYTIDQRPPGRLRAEGNPLLAPRLSTWLQARAGTHVEVAALGRLDRGFDPGERSPQARLDEYFLRVTPFDSPVLSVTAGKFATVFGSWVRRHESWENPLVNAPLPYDAITTVGDLGVPARPADLLARKRLPDRKGAWLALVWGPSYASGAAVTGRVQRLDYAIEVKNAALSSRPSVWGFGDRDLGAPTVTGRLGVRPTPAWDVGVSGSHGAYLRDEARPGRGRSAGDFYQDVAAGDVSWAHGPWQLWSETVWSRFEVPNVGTAEAVGYYVELKRKLTSRLWLASRWNQQLYGDVPDGRGGEARWDEDVWRVDLATGLRWNRSLQGKIQYSFTHQNGPLQQGEQMVAAQVTLRF